ncbi:hypothetical protein [Bradyrhizobium guangdongense]|uniref:hypothetical protein n=1 Tax=Bradyrhizobium guangdongense TaxID=1325090 RepID=UPI0018F7DC0C|nr:hypothetical protein [Bradyrhizobium guangdongense]
MRLALALPQFVEELLKMCWEARFGPEALLQPLAYCVANRAAGAPVDLFAVIGKEASHRGSVL